jgi:hypothetical protein
MDTPVGSRRSVGLGSTSPGSRFALLARKSPG